MAANVSTVFVVDDSPTVGEVVLTVLSSAGFRVKSFECAQDALASLRAETASLVITDIFMPSMDGLEFIRQLRSFNRTVPVIAMSGNERLPQQLAVAKLLGANMLLKKPFSAQALLETVTGALETTRLLTSRVPELRLNNQE